MDPSPLSWFISISSISSENNGQTQAEQASVKQLREITAKHTEGAPKQHTQETGGSTVGRRTAATEKASSSSSEEQEAAAAEDWSLH